MTDVGEQSHQQGKAGSPGTAIGIVAGLIAVLLAVMLAGMDTSFTGSRMASGSTRTIDVELSGMRVRPDTVEVTPGTRLVLRVTNREELVHDLRLDTGERTPRLRNGQTAVLAVVAVV